MSLPVYRALHCINPECPRPYPQPWGNKFCHSCGSPLKLNNRYIPLDRLGAGGFAKIYTVWDLKTQTEQVLKVLVEASPKALELFEQEANVLVSLRHHPGVPSVEPDGYFQVAIAGMNPRLLPCLVMEKIDGQTLEAVLQQHPQGCAESWVINWLNQAVEILKELHNHHIIHRDIKPSNLMLRSSTGQLVMIDFGGAKQIGSAWSRQASSTRLFSSGYSPPEQVIGKAVEPSVDFYALGRTMIQMLTGKHPAELEDPVTGKLQWRSLVKVNPSLADLLDEITQDDVRQRLGSVKEIQARLAAISANTKPASSKSISNDIAALAQGITRTTLVLWQGFVYLVRACLDISREMLLGAVGATISTAIGFVFAYFSPLGVGVADFVWQKLPGIVPPSGIVAGPQLLLCAVAGLGTAWGLTAAGGFGQRRRYLVSPLMGIIAYGCAWLIWVVELSYNPLWAVVGAIFIAVALLTLGLGLRSHHLVHTIVAGVGTSTVFAVLLSTNIVAISLFNPYIQPSWLEFGCSIAFFGSISVILSFWLGVSYYLIAPGLRFLGWH